VGEVLYIPLYNGEKIGKNFTLEIWSVDGETSVDLATALTIVTSIRTIPTDFTSTTPPDLGDGDLTVDIYATQFDDNFPSIAGFTNSGLWIGDSGPSNVGLVTFVSWTDVINGNVLTPTGGNVYVDALALAGFLGVYTDGSSYIRPFAVPITLPATYWVVMVIKKDPTQSLLFVSNSATPVSLYDDPSVDVDSGAHVVTPVIEMEDNSIDYIVMKNDGSGAGVTSVQVGSRAITSQNFGAAVTSSFVGLEDYQGRIFGMAYVDTLLKLSAVVEYFNKKFKIRVPLPLTFSDAAIGADNP